MAAHGGDQPRRLRNASYCSFTFWHHALKAPNLALVGALSYLTPPLAILLVGLVHGTAISPFVWGGMALILAASYLCRRFG